MDSAGSAETKPRNPKTAKLLARARHCYKSVWRDAFIFGYA